MDAELGDLGELLGGEPTAALILVDDPHPRPVLTASGEQLDVPAPRQAPRDAGETATGWVRW
ncbi:hypothetical protein DRB89_42445 [Streptomyces sp. ICC4]|nr:hypothetical protein DRB89_42445 [Streptomyces sp. ICC4]